MESIPHLPLATAVTASVDWYTATATSREDPDTLFRFGIELLRRDRARGNRAREKHWYGYTGPRTGYAFAGEGKWGACVWCVGDLADQTFDELRGLDCRITRLDHAVTLQLPETLEEVVEVVRDAFIAARDSLPNPPEWDYHHSSDGGSTFEVGKRANDIYGRVYDKHRQSRGAYPPGTYRWELEAKKPTSHAHASCMLASADRRGASGATVRSWFAQRYVPTPWADVAGDVLPRGTRERSDDERWRGWLDKQVRPSLARRGRVGREILISWLLQDYGGQEEE
jgi:hypothetical protein